MKLTTLNILLVSIVLFYVSLGTANPVGDSSHSTVSITHLKRITPSQISVGQVGGLDTDENGYLFVFHRGSRVWTWDSFNDSNAFNRDKYGPIEDNVLSLIDPESLEIYSWGKNKFYMPHGLTYDFEGYLWLTDVGLHQVFKYDIQNEQIVMTLGEKFINGNDDKHFCKPTSVAVSETNGDIFIADGYCNKRVVQFDRHGKYIKSFTDEKNEIIVAHSIALLENYNLVCTVSRQDGRIICFDIDTGNKKVEITNELMKTVYGIEYDPLAQVIHAVTGQNSGAKPLGLTFDARKEKFGQLLFKWEPKANKLTDAHDIAISPDGSKIFTGQLNGEIDEFIFE